MSMTMEIGRLLEVPPDAFSVTILAGQNGAGKSRYLESLALHYAIRKHPVVVICNTPFDRFRRMSGVKRISASRGRRLPADVLKSAFVRALGSSPIAFRTLSKTLEYCGYGPEIGVRITKLDESRFRTEIQASTPPLFESSAEEEQVFAALQTAREASEAMVWLDYSSDSFRSLLQESFAVLMKHEVLLRRYGALKQIDLFLRRGEASISLTQASSGELTLISALVFLSVEVEDGAVILIDEPENSLHPQWQKEYVQRLANLLHYSRAKIFIATHAPVIVSGAEADPDIHLRVFHAMLDHVEQLKTRTSSVEETLWSVFQTVTPQSHFVSQTLSRELSTLANGESSPSEIMRTIADMQQAAYDPKQREFFEAALRLAEKVATGNDDA